MLDRFIQIVKEHDLKPEDIEYVKAQPHPMAQFDYAKRNVLTTDEDYCFNLRYLLSCAVHGIKPSFWHYPEVKQDPEIQRFMKNLNLEIFIDERDFALAKLRDPNTYQMRIEVKAKGEIYKGVGPYLKGTWEPEDLRNTDEELIDKFVHNVSKIVPKREALKAGEMMFELEKLDGIGKLLDMLS